MTRSAAEVEVRIHKIHAKRVAAGQCRHCGGPVPCWSMFGDRAVGKRHTLRSYERARRDAGFPHGGGE